MSESEQGLNLQICGRICNILHDCSLLKVGVGEEGFLLLFACLFVLVPFLWFHIWNQTKPNHIGSDFFRICLWDQVAKKLFLPIFTDLEPWILEILQEWLRNGPKWSTDVLIELSVTLPETAWEPRSVKGYYSWRNFKTL